MGYKKNSISIKWQLFLFLIVILVLLFSVRNYLALNTIRSSLTQELENRLSISNGLVHDTVNNLVSNSLKSYLRGRVEDSIYSFNAVFRAYNEGRIPLETAMNNLIRGLESREVGKSGYYFIMDSEGIIIYHPFEEYLGQDFSEYDFINTQIESREGYVEYLWKNPDDAAPKEKAMYSMYFEEMDWIISITAYRAEFSDILDFKNLRENILKSQVEGEVHYIADIDGTVLLHPQIEGGNVFDFPELSGLYRVFNEYKSEGITEGTLLLEVGEDPISVTYSWIPEFDWVIFSLISLDYFNQPIYEIRRLYGAFDIVLILFLTISILLILNITLKPLKDFSNELLRSDVCKELEINMHGDEVLIAKEVFQFYINQLNEDKVNLKEIAANNEILADYPNCIQIPVLRIRSDLTCSYLNDWAKREFYPFTLGEPVRQLVGEPFASQILENRDGFFDIHILGKAYRVLITSSSLTKDFYLNFLDKTSETRLHTLQSIWDKVFDHSIEGITITDESGKVEKINKSFSLITGYEEADIIGQSTNLLKSDRHDSSFYEDMWIQLVENNHWEGEIWNRKKSGELYIEWLSISGFEDNRTKSRKYMAIFHDISDQYNKNREIDFISSHDVLTGLPSRNLFNDRLQMLISNSTRTEEIFSVIIMDIYQFNRINENLGMSTGDQLLIEVSGILKNILREGDLIARLGSDEFGLVLTQLNSRNQSLEIIQRIQKELSNRIELNGSSIKPIINMGICFYPADGTDVDSLMMKASTALKKAKAQKPGSFVFFDDDMHLELYDRFELEESLKIALENKEFVLQYQPKTDCIADEVVGYEALIRWRNPNGDFVSPVKFIPILEENGLIVETGYWIIEEVCHFITRFQKRFSKTVNVGINISAKQFIHHHFLENLAAILQKHQVDPSHIDLEITENIAATDSLFVKNTIKEARKTGFTISIDDFGTGYSSLHYLKELDFNTLKIDKSFVDPLPEDKKSLSIAKSIIDLAKNLGKDIVVEGVETEAQKLLFQDLGCRIIQGYYYSKPLFEEEIN